VSSVGANWNFERKVTVADSVYGPIGTLITAKGSKSLSVSQIGQVDMTLDTVFSSFRRCMPTSMRASTFAMSEAVTSTITGCSSCTAGELGEMLLRSGIVNDA
jgi:hypothetical protein